MYNGVLIFKSGEHTNKNICLSKQYSDGFKSKVKHKFVKILRPAPLRISLTFLEALSGPWPAHHDIQIGYSN